MIAYLAGLAGPACSFVLAAVWSMRSRADEFLDGSDFDSATFVRFQAEAAKLRLRTLQLAAPVALATVAALGPAIALQLTNVVEPWMATLSGSAVGLCTYAYIIVSDWERQLKDFRAKLLIQSKRLKEQEDLLARIRTDAPIPSGIGWASSGESLKVVERH